jgi:hypothetical protein
VRQPRVRDREAAGGERICFSSTILPPYARRTKNLEVLIPIEYAGGADRRYRAAILRSRARQPLPATVRPISAGTSPGTITIPNPELAPAFSNVCLAVLITTARGIASKRGLLRANIDDESARLLVLAAGGCLARARQDWPVALSSCAMSSLTGDGPLSRRTGRPVIAPRALKRGARLMLAPRVPELVAINRRSPDCGGARTATPACI